MDTELTLEDLEQSLIQRANQLADEFKDRAKRSHDHYIDDENERLQLREERETLKAKMSSEKLYRSQVQSSELKIQKQLDQLRWRLITEVVEEVKIQLEELVLNHDKYFSTLINYTTESIHTLSKQSDSNVVILQLNQRDYTWLSTQWPSFIQQVIEQTIEQDFNQNSYQHSVKGEDKSKAIKLDKIKFELNPKCHEMNGGLIIYDETYSIRIDNTIEGRMERFSETIYQQVSELFFSELSHEGDKVRGR